ncbi:hypothetical protein [Apilactobacillus quenuiae]|uniref:hypothetical protein n=1 Tax=Apilactobacillus quenuiae TaxID=2008377 RepID=UPI000D01A835|nr:hypothetical protein [Apilactobacillus quenuiae]
MLINLIKYKGKTVNDVVDAMHEKGIKISKSTFYRKSRNDDFTFGEMLVIEKILNMSMEEIDHIFLHTCY